MLRPTVPFLLAALAALFLPACGGGTPGATVDSTGAADSTGAVTEVAPARPVTRIVFIDQEEACDCTRARIDTTWAALQLALEGHEPIPVERIHGDTQQPQAKPYLDMRPLMVAPGLYFLDADGGLVEQLQGELTEGQIVTLLP